MMIELFAVRDTLVGFSQPFCAENENAAIRMFAASVRSQQPNVCNTFPENKELWKVAIYDDSNGAIVSDCKHLANAQSYVMQSTVSPILNQVKIEDLEEKDENGTSDNKDS